MESATARGYIHGDSARCAVTGRLDVERLAASRGRYLSYSRTTLLVPRYDYIAKLRGTCKHVGSSRSAISLTEEGREWGKERGLSRNSSTAIIRADFLRANDIGNDRSLSFLLSFSLSSSLWWPRERYDDDAIAVEASALFGKWTLLFPVLSLSERSFHRGRETHGRKRRVSVGFEKLPGGIKY